MRRDHRSSIRSTRAREASVVFAITPGVHSTGCHQIHNSYSFASHDPSMSPHSKNITSTVTTSFVIDQPNVSVRPPPVMTRPRVPSVPPPFARAKRTFSPRPRRGGGVVERGVRSTRARGRRGRLASGMRRDVIPLGGIAREMVDASASARDAGEVRHPSTHPRRRAMRMIIREATRDATRRTRGGNTCARTDRARADVARTDGWTDDGTPEVETTRGE